MKGSPSGLPFSCPKGGTNIAMKLVIAEKPSVAISIAAVLGAKEREEGCVAGKEFIVSWCYGPLAELADPAVYGEQYAKWRLDDLPMHLQSFSASWNKSRSCAGWRNRGLGVLPNKHETADPRGSGKSAVFAL